jgi:hypothetical protein
MNPARACRIVSATFLSLQLGTGCTADLASQSASTSARDHLFKQAEVLDDDPSASHVENLALIHATGSGCPADSTTSFYDAESMTLVVQFSEYVIDISSAQQVGTRDCALELLVSYAGGLGNVVANVQYRGYANLPPRTSAILETSYLFSGRTDAATTVRNELNALSQKPWAVAHQVRSTQGSDVDCSTQRFLWLPTLLTSFNDTPEQDAHVDIESIEISLVSLPETTNAPCAGR